MRPWPVCLEEVMALRSVRVVANAGNKELRTVNVVTTQADPPRFEQCAQVSGDQGREIETVQAAAAPTAGLPTIYIPGYAGPA